MHHKGLAESLQGRVIEHYYLQDQLWHGVNLPSDVNHLMYDTPECKVYTYNVPINTMLHPIIQPKFPKMFRPGRRRPVSGGRIVL